MGFDTGCNKSHNDLNGDDYWVQKKLNIMEEVANGTKEICYGLGVGYGKEGVERYISDETEIMIGVNNSKITLTVQERHPRTDKRMSSALRLLV